MDKELKKELGKIGNEFVKIGKEFGNIAREFTKVHKRLDQFESSFATKDDLEGFATKGDLKGFATKGDLKGFATKDDLKALPTKEYIDDLLTKHTRKIIDYAVPRWEFEEFKETVFTKQDYMDHLATLDDMFAEFRRTESNNVLIGEHLCRIDDTVDNHEKRIRVLEK